MQVKMVAFESMGIRSMCTHVETSNLSILIDAGAACHTRSGVSPHPLEYEALIRKRAEILSLSRDADLIIVSHYHLHHFSLPVNDLATTFCTKPMSDEIFGGKALLCKDPGRKVTEIQGRRGMEFRRVYGKRSPRYEVADGRSFDFGDTKISFSPALWHGPDGTVQGYVVGTCVRDGEKTLVHASDVQLLNRGCVDWMLGQDPDIAITSGPPLFDPERVMGSERSIALSLLRRLSQQVPQVVVDHHLLRATNWKDFMVEGGNDVMCAANMEREPPLALESRRAALYEEEDVEEGFHKQLEDGIIPDRLRPAIYKAGTESYYEASLS